MVFSMNSHRRAHGLERAGKECSALVVMILYEDDLTGSRAKRMLDRVVRDVELSEPVDLRVCKLDWLNDDVLCRKAACMAADSEIVVVSTYGRSTVPKEVEGWLENWRKVRCDQPCALAALLHGDTGSSERFNPWLSRLRHAAREGRADFFYSLCDVSSLPGTTAMQQAVRCRAHETRPPHPAQTSRPESHPHAKPTRHWGINE